MQRILKTPRPDWQNRVEDLGFSFHTLEGIYWDESAYYKIDYYQVETLETATVELYDMCLEAVQHVIDNKLYDKLGIPKQFVSYIEQSWNDDHPSVYGRFDFAYDGENPPKLLEFNADTPTSLFEAGIVQWFWLQDFNKELDQFNSIHERLVECWAQLKPYLNEGKVYFSSVKDNDEDFITVQYIRDCALQAGLDTDFIFVDDIGFAEDGNCFVDLENRRMSNIFKLYPWEWMIHEDFGQKLLLDTSGTFWMEPAWKMILANKGILPVLWKLYPDHPNLLPAYFENEVPVFGFNEYVKKPLLSREGANIEIVKDYSTLHKTGGDYGEEGFICQQFNPLPDFDGNFPVVGSWLIGGEPAGIGIRESNNLITDNTSRFVPHLIEDDEE